MLTTLKFTGYFLFSILLLVCLYLKLKFLFVRKFTFNKNLVDLCLFNGVNLTNKWHGLIYISISIFCVAVCLSHSLAGINRITYCFKKGGWLIFGDTCLLEQVKFSSHSFPFWLHSFDSNVGNVSGKPLVQPDLIPPCASYQVAEPLRTEIRLLQLR